MNAEVLKPHQSQLVPAENKFHVGNKKDGLHYWITPPEIMIPLNDIFDFDFDPCPFPKPEGFNGLECEWGQRNFVNPPFGSIPNPKGFGRKIGPTGWMRKTILEQQKNKFSFVVYPVDKWVLMMINACAQDGFFNTPLFEEKTGLNKSLMLEQIDAGRSILNLGDVQWLATEDQSQGKGLGRHIAAFIVRGIQ